MEERFFYCETCGNLLIAAIASGVIPYCCGDEMSLLTPNQTDGSGEKHLPCVDEVDEHRLRISVGSVLHPMTAEHSIRFVCLVTTEEVIIHYLSPDDSPVVELCFQGKPVCAYAYCNLHGLWRTDVDNA